eukprot:1790680-Pyramimonas_sp.AAC.1
MPGASPVLENDQMSLSAVRGPEQAGQEALPVAAHCRRWRQMPLLASIVVARCPRARALSSAPFALRAAFAASSLRAPTHRSRVP